MPTEEEIARGGAKRYRTIKLPGGKFAHVAIVPKEGERGGHTVMGPIRKKKKKIGWDSDKSAVDSDLKEKGY